MVYDGEELKPQPILGSALMPSLCAGGRLLNLSAWFEDFPPRQQMPQGLSISAAAA